MGGLVCFHCYRLSVAILSVLGALGFMDDGQLPVTKIGLASAGPNALVSLGNYFDDSTDTLTQLFDNE
jgi:hypothetical protein